MCYYTLFLDLDAVYTGCSVYENSSDCTLVICTIYCMNSRLKSFFTKNSPKDRDIFVWEDPRQKNFSELLATFILQAPLGSSTQVDSWVEDLKRG